MREDWQKVKLADACLYFTDGDWIESKDQDFSGIRLIQTGNIGFGQFKNRSDKARYINEETFDRLKCKLVLEGDCLISRLPDPVGRACIIPNTGERIITAVDCTIVRFKKDFVYTDFFKYYSQSKNYISHVDKMCTGATRKRISRQNLGKVEILVPPLPEQKRIVAILDEAFEGIDRASAIAEKNLANARELFESYLNAVFTQKNDEWVEKKLEDICSITAKLVDPCQPEVLDLPHVGAGNMISLTGELIEVKTAREEELKSGKFLFDETMVLYSKIRPYLMKACRPDFSGLCSADVYPLLPNDGQLNRDFLFHLLMSRNFTEYAISGSDRAGMPKVNREHLFRYSIWIPSISEQINLAQKIDALSLETQRLEAVYRQKIAALKELKQSILQKAFTGELTAATVEKAA